MIELTKYALIVSSCASFLKGLAINEQNAEKRQAINDFLKTVQEAINQK